MRVVPFLMIGAWCLGLTGCAILGKKTPASPTTAPGASAPSAPQFGRPTASPANIGAAPPTTVGGFLAGQVIDNQNGIPPAVYIQVSEPGVSSGAPIEVAADSRGYFTIQGLQPGRNYLLTARARSGDRLWSGMMLATPPNPRLLIRVNPELTPASNSVPSAPSISVPNGPGSIQPPSPPITVWPSPPGAGNDQAWAPGRGAAPSPNRGYLGGQAPNAARQAAELGPPVALPPSSSVVPGNGSSGQSSPAEPRVGIPLNQVADGDRQLAKNDPPSPKVILPNQWAPVSGNNPGGPAVVQPNPKPSGWDPPAAPPVDPFFPGGQARVPSCVLTGQTLHNLALNDVNGQPWEFRQHYGKLVLIDFWGTWCQYCLQAIPHLKDLQLRYGPYGLEVIGLAYEEGTQPERVEKVNRVANRLGINYRILMGSDRKDCPVRTQFQVEKWPTLVLLDEQGHILWRGEGADREEFQELEIIIRQRLGLR